MRCGTCHSAHSSRTGTFTRDRPNRYTSAYRCTFEAQPGRRRNPEKLCLKNAAQGWWHHTPRGAHRQLCFGSALPLQVQSNCLPKTRLARTRLLAKDQNPAAVMGYVFHPGRAPTLGTVAAPFSPLDQWGALVRTAAARPGWPAPQVSISRCPWGNRHCPARCEPAAAGAGHFPSKPLENMFATGRQEPCRAAKGAAGLSDAPAAPQDAKILAAKRAPAVRPLASCPHLLSGRP
jgi:hypothetical protein